MPSTCQGKLLEASVANHGPCTLAGLTNLCSSIHVRLKGAPVEAFEDGSTYTSIYIYIHICVFICWFICLCIYIYIYIYTHIQIFSGYMDNAEQVQAQCRTVRASCGSATAVSHCGVQNLKAKALHVERLFRAGVGCRA